MTPTTGSCQHFDTEGFSLSTNISKTVWGGKMWRAAHKALENRRHSLVDVWFRRRICGTAPVGSAVAEELWQHYGQERRRWFSPPMRRGGRARETPGRRRDGQ